MNTDTIETWMTQNIAEALQCPETSLDRELPLTALGLDSVSILGLAGELAEFTKQDIPVSLVWEYPTIASLSAQLATLVAEQSTPQNSTDVALKDAPLSFSQERGWRYANHSDDPLNTQCKEQEIAEFIAQHIAKELKKEPSEIDIHAPFQDFGLESIFYVELVGDLAEWHEVDIPKAIFLDETCILGIAARLATYIEKEADTLPSLDDWLPIALKHGLHAKELSILRQFSFHSPIGQKRQTCLTFQANKVADSIPIFWFFPLKKIEAITQATPDRSTYISPAGWTGIDHSERFVKALASYYTEEITRINPGPTIEVGGFCRGAKIALETARLLEQRGYEVQKLYLFDSIGPYPNRKKIFYRYQIWRRLINRCIRTVHSSLKQLKVRRIFFEEWFCQPEPIHIPTLIITCRDGCFNAPMLPINGWGDIIKGPNECVLIPGEHHGMLNDQATIDAFKIAINEHHFKEEWM
jgi:acyl carrier protein/thioesterase domain-containing protein